MRRRDREDVRESDAEERGVVAGVEGLELELEEVGVFLRGREVFDAVIFILEPALLGAKSARSVGALLEPVWPMSLASERKRMSFAGSWMAKSLSCIPILPAASKDCTDADPINCSNFFTLL